jgi:serine phosphatase RsbU (regulator of sigma subunit)
VSISRGSLQTFNRKIKKSLEKIRVVVDFHNPILRACLILLIVVTIILFLFYSYRQSKTGNIFDEANLPAAEKQIWKAMNLYDSNLIQDLADSLENTGDISAVTADYYRGAAAANKGMLTVSEQYLKKATANSQPEAADLRVYLKSRALLSRILASESDYEGALNEALPTLAMIDSLGNKDYGDITQLHIVIGESQQHLHMPVEAAASFDKAYALLLEWMKSDITGKDMPRIILRLDNIATSYIHTSEYAKAKIWLDREDSALAIYNTLPGVVEKQADFLRGTIQLDLAVMCQQLGQDDEAVSHYSEHLKTIFSDRNVALINATDYLMLTGRYGEAADNYICLDKVLAKRSLDLSLDNIGTYLLPKMRANILAGRKDSAIAVGMMIAENYDSALSRQKQDATAELATVYDTQGKEHQIAEQEMNLSRVRVTSLVVAIIALIVFFVVIDIFRHRSAKRLAKVNAAKERMEGELSIARDIQMSMVPSAFPEVDGLDMYASMTPAKEVGGDLYNFLLIDHSAARSNNGPLELSSLATNGTQEWSMVNGQYLYFCVGDVSGKGVPASLFMAQATRLFHMLASQDMMPAEICSQINEALSGPDNENSMFVTMFVGLLNLKTGHLDFCNAGHNAPVIGGGESGGEFLDMLSNAPIGLWPGLEYEGEEIDSIKGRLLFVYTDGLNEAENSQKEQLGDERLLEILRATRFENARQVIDSLSAAVEQHRNGAEPNDDLTMLCLKL